MRDTILVAVDFSPASLAAVAHAAALGKGADVRLVHIVPRSSIVAPLVAEAEVELVRVGRGKLEAIARDLEAQGIRGAHVEIRRGRPAGEILIAAKHSRAKLILMGAHAKSTLGRLVLGSVSDEVVRASPVPTLVVRERSVEEMAAKVKKPRKKEKPARNRAHTIERLLLAIDHSPPSRAAARLALELAKKIRAKVEAIHVIEAPRIPYYLRREINEDGHTWTELSDDVSCAIGKELKSALGEKLRVRFVVGRPATEIVAAARVGDLIVCGTHARSGLKRLAFGGNATRLLRRAPCPVLVVPPGGDPPGGDRVGSCVVQ